MIIKTSKTIAKLTGTYTIVTDFLQDGDPEVKEIVFDEKFKCTAGLLPAHREENCIYIKARPGVCIKHLMMDAREALYGKA